MLVTVGLTLAMGAGPSSPAGADVEVGRITLPGGANYGARIDPTTGLVYSVVQYVFDGSSVHSWLYVMDDGAVIDQVQLPYAAQGWDIDPTRQRAYIVTAEGSSTITYTLRVVDLTTRTIVASRSLPQAFYVDADPISGRVAIGLYDSNRVLILDGPTLGTVAEVALAVQPTWVLVAPGADAVYVNAQDASLTLELSGPTYSTTRTFPGNPGGMAMAFDDASGVLYTTNQSGVLRKIDVATGAVLDSDPTPPWGNHMTWMVLDDGGQRLLGRDRGGQMAILDTVTLDEIGVVGGFDSLAWAVGDDATQRIIASDGFSNSPSYVIELAPTVPPAVLPGASAVATTVTEGDPLPGCPWPWCSNGLVDVMVDVTLDQPSTEWVRVTIDFVAGSATTPQDFYGSDSDVYFAPGATTGQAVMTLVSDEVAEATESLSFAVTEALGATVDPSPATITVLDDDVALPVAALVPLDPVGGEAEGLVDFAIELDAESDVEVTVDWSVSAGSASAGDDFDDAGGQAVFAAGETLVTQSVAVVDDADVEGDETFSISLTGASGATIDGSDATATITDDDEIPPPVPVASIQPVDPTGVEGEQTVQFFVELDVPSADEVTVDWSVSAGSASAGDDFDDAGGQAVFAPGETLVEQSVGVVDDGEQETDETFTIALTGATGATVDGVDVEATIIDDDTPPSVVTAGANVAIAEGPAGASRTASVRVVFNPPTTGEVEVGFVAQAISATEYVDFAVAPDPVTVPAGTSQATIQVEILGDAEDEPNETLDIQLAGVTGNAVLGGDVTARVTINDDDAAPRFSVDDVSVAEGGQLDFHVSLSGASGRTVTVRHATSRGTGAEAADFTNATGTLTFDPGETSATVSVQTVGDNIDELAEQVILNLSSATNATILDNRGFGTIIDDDTSTVTITGVSVAEGNTAQRSASFLMHLSNPSDRSVGVTVGTVDGTAISTTTLRDYVSYNATITFTPGQISKPATVKVIGDRRVESAETFNLVVNAVNSGALGVGNTATGTIQNDD